MLNRKGQRCPYCGEVFGEQDDIVVCPDCGTPQHRSCYIQNRQCANHALHAAGFEWKPETPEGPMQGEAMVCPQCNHPNPPLSLFCNNCGFPMQDRQRQDGTPQQYTAESNADNVFTGHSQFGQQDPTQGQPYWNSDGSDSFFGRDSHPVRVDSNTEFDGIPAKQWVEYIGPSTPYYLTNFVYQDRYNRKIGFVWSAAIVPYVYFAYRRVWWAAVTSLLLMLACSMPNVLIMLHEQKMIDLGVTLTQYNTLGSVANICNYIYIGVRVLCGIFAVYLFRKNAAKQIKAAMQREDGIIPNGPSSLGVVIILLLYLVITMMIGVVLSKIFTVTMILV